MLRSLFFLLVLSGVTAQAQSAREKEEMASLAKPANDPEEGGSAYQLQASCGFVVPLTADYEFLRDKEWISSNENAVGYCAHAQVAMYELCSESPAMKESLKRKVKKIHCTYIPSAKDKPESPVVELKGDSLLISFGRRSYTRVQGEVTKLLSGKR